MATGQQPRRMVTFAQAAVYTLIVIAILSVLNFLANRWNKSFDSTSNKRFTLSDQTAKIVRNLKPDLTISYWDQPTRFQQAQDLLDRYKNLSTKINVQYQDTEKKRTQAIAAGVKSQGTIFVQVGNKKEEAKSLTETDVTGAIIRAIKTGDRIVCSVAGSGEPALDETGNSGYSNLKDLTERNNYKMQSVNLVQKAEIPKECTILMVAGPKRDYLAPAVSAIKAYVEDGGRALFMLDPPLKFGSGIDENAALTAVIEGWGVKLQKDIVLDVSGVGQVFGLGPQFPLVLNYGSHPIVNEMKNLATGYPIVRSLEVNADGPTKPVKLAETSADSFATQNLAAPEIKEGKDDLKGPLTLAAAGTYTTSKENGNGRYVVVGTSRLAGNNFLGLNGNRDLYLNMLNWLSSDEDLISIRPKDPEDRRLNMNQRQVTTMFYTSVLGFPLLIVVAGVGVWWRRR